MSLSSTTTTSTVQSHRAYTASNGMNKLTNKADSFAHGVKEHEKLIRLGPKITETVKGKLRLGAKIVKARGALEVFKHAFSANAVEKLLKASQCYWSTTAGPMAGLIFISTDKIAFCSEEVIMCKSSVSIFEQGNDNHVLWVLFQKKKKKIAESMATH
ncbi:hypothetical protein DVH24_018717 [Malus domestica]|uniref:Uncharacterized protein n=1 Tax=Malus domestica TaxID=3750 RepID=A0A498HN91_MALDO|nr:hypothetical protein DVH24_018717 [Malus domestica]